MRAKKRLGDMLVEAGVINESQLGAALGRQKQWGGRLGTNLILLGFLTEQELTQFLSESLELPQVDLSERKADKGALDLLKETVARQYNVLPLATLRKDGKDVLELAVADPTNLEALDTVAAVTRRKIDPFVTMERDLMSAIDFYYKGVGAKPVSRGPLTPPPMENFALVRPSEEQMFDLDSGRSSPIPTEPGKDGDAKKASAGAKPGDAEAAPPKPPADAAATRGSDASMPAGGEEAAPGPPPSMADLTRSLRETRAMVVVLAEMLMERGVVDQDEFYRRYGLKKILF